MEEGLVSTLLKDSIVTVEEFNTVYRDRLEATVSLFMRSGYDLWTAEDLAQEVFILFLRNATYFKEEKVTSSRKNALYNMWYMSFLLCVSRIKRNKDRYITIETTMSPEDMINLIDMTTSITQLSSGYHSVASDPLTPFEQCDTNFTSIQHFERTDETLSILRRMYEINTDIGRIAEGVLLGDSVNEVRIQLANEEGISDRTVRRRVEQVLKDPVMVQLIRYGIRR